MQLAAFGDPVYSEAKKTEDSEFVFRSGLRMDELSPLPATRWEVESIGALFPGANRIYVGEEALEEEAKQLKVGIGLIHFACHGILDEKFPLNSGLALTIPEEMEEGRDNGLFQAWEIFEQVRIDADLVTLSACQTGLGGEMGGEGLIGLTRAFLYAGTKSVLASLWSVADVTTAEFMKRFYGHLKQGSTKDEALQRAQVAFIRKSTGIKDETGTIRQIDVSHPLYWAAFQLIGDWK